MGINKVKYGNTTLLDLTSDTVTPSVLMQGYTAHDRSGALITGTAIGGSAVVSQDQDGYLVLDDKAGEVPTIASLNVTQNGTYTAPTGVAYSPVTVDVPSSQPTGIKYLYSDVDGEGAWHNISGYEYYSYDYAPIKDNKYRLWIRVNSSTGLTVMTKVYARANKVIIDWGDGNSSYAVASPYENTHTYDDEGTYCIEISDPTNNRMRAQDYAMGQSSSVPNETLVGVELYGTSAPTYLANTFDSCINLKRASIINGSVNSYFFRGCTSLESVSFHSGITTLSPRILMGCTSLHDLCLTPYITRIGANAYDGCVGLQNITIPSTITSIDNQAFANCSGLREVHLMATTPPTAGSDIFHYVNMSNVTIYVPSANLNDYQTAENWSTYASYMVGE